MQKRKVFLKRTNKIPIAGGYGQELKTVLIERAKKRACYYSDI